MEKLSHQKIAGLVKRVKKGDHSAFEELYSIMSPKVYYNVYFICKNKQTAEDITQEVFMQILRSIHTLQNDKLFVAWCNRIAYNYSIRYINTQKTTDNIDDLDEYKLAQTNGEGDLDMRYLKQESYEELSQYISELSIEHRTVILMRYYQDLSMQEIADIVKCPVGTVKSRLNAAKKILASKLGTDHNKIKLSAFLFGSTITQALRQSSHSITSTSFDIHGSFQQLYRSIKDINHFTKSPNSGKSFFKQTLAASAAGAVATFIAFFAWGMHVDIHNIEITNHEYFISSNIFVELKNSPYLKNIYAIAPSGTILQPVDMVDQIVKFDVRQNGAYEIIAVAYNNKSISKTAVVSEIDTEPPQVKEYFIEGDRAVLYFTDDRSGVHFEQFAQQYGTASEENQKIMNNLVIDEQSGSVSFDLGEKEFTISLIDKAGNSSKNLVRIV